jgi:cation diffusion facilitator family transporter
VIFYEAVHRFQHPAAIEYQGLAMFVIIASMAVSYWVYRQNLAASRATDSSALRVNALHFLSDVVASLGVLLGLVLLKWTGWSVIDPIIAILVAVYIVIVAGRQIMQAIGELSDTQLPEAEVRDIRSVLDSFRGRMIEAHDLRTRKSGAFRHVDFHLVVCGELTVERSHEVCDEMENAIQAKYPAASVSIHVEPCGHVRGPSCRETCPVLREREQSLGLEKKASP